MLDGIVGAAPNGAQGFDCNVKLTADNVKVFKKQGFAFVVRYVGRKAEPKARDLDTAEANIILDGGLGLMAVQHVEEEPWEPSAAKGATYGQNAAKHAQDIGLPAGVTLWLDLEGVSSAVGSQTIIDYCNAWFNTVIGAGYVPGIYVGANCGLSGDQLYWQLHTRQYWKSGSTVPDIPQRGYCMVQRIVSGDSVDGVGIDRNLVRSDGFGGTPFMLTRDAAMALDVPEDVPEDLPAEVLEAAEAIHTTNPLAVDTKLPLPSPGLTGHYTEDRHYGTAATIAALLEIGRIWDQRRPGALISIGDISQKGGGQISGHASHRKGIDLDMRMMKADGNSAQMVYTDAIYSHDVTQELVDLFYGNGVLAVQLVFFNDASISGVQHWPEHDNHLHVRFYLPETQPAWPVVQRGSKGPKVRELQRRLGYWLGAHPGAFPAIGIDGDFGQHTFDAVSALQAAAGLPADGVAGKDVWTALPTA